ncbi:zf-HC2 domain-containing protein [bacterium]|nr:zf-HC2 domain-containing protein [bacterium]
MSHSHNGQEDHSHLIPCSEVLSKVYAFIDGQLDVKELEGFQEHIRLCLPCNELVKFEEKLVETIKKKGCHQKSEIPSSLMDKIKQAISTSSKP